MCRFYECKNIILYRSPKDDVVKFPSTSLYCKSILAGNPKSTECLDLMRKEILEKWEKSSNKNTSKDSFSFGN
ncbi:unnamed protein product, partial [Iphiclides podalirius]